MIELRSDVRRPRARRESASSNKLSLERRSGSAVGGGTPPPVGTRTTRVRDQEEPVARRLAVLALLVFASSAPAALADGQMPFAAQNSSGVLSPDGSLRYLALNDRPNTVLAEVQTKDGTLRMETTAARFVRDPDDRGRRPRRRAVARRADARRRQPRPRHAEPLPRLRHAHAADEERDRARRQLRVRRALARRLAPLPDPAHRGPGTATTRTTSCAPTT